MKPLQIGLLVLVGALVGAMIVKFTQRPTLAPVPIASATPAPAPGPATPALVTPKAAPEPVAAPKPEVPKAAPAAPPVRRTKPARQTHPAAVTIARNVPPAQPEPVRPHSEPTPIDETAPPIKSEPAPAPAPVTTPPAPEESVEPPAPQPAPSVTLQAGTMLPVRLGESLSSEHNQAGDTFTGTLDAPLSAGGFVIAERGARVEGRVIEAQKSGRVNGQARLALELTNLNTSDGQHVAIMTAILRKQATTMAAGDQVGIVAAAAGIGAVIGAIAGGGKGAAIGAGAGGAAGAGGVVATRDKAVALPTESKLTFRLSAPVTITEQLNR